MELKNNSQEMKTVVETFVIEETQELIYDNDKLEEWNKYVSELGLNGQTQIVKPSKSPIPFLHLKRSMVAVFECLCPRKVKVEEYNVSPIPVEILSLVSLSKKEGYFDRLEIWYDEKSPDPVCIGVKSPYYAYDDNDKLHASYPSYDEALKVMNKNGWTKNKPYPNTWSADVRYYILGKWADVKHSFEELKEMATKRFVAEKSNELEKTIRTAQRELDDIKTLAFDKFN